MQGRGFKLHRLLIPFSFLYGIGVKIRNLMFDWGILPSEEYPVPVISIGNLAVGGTGKTPHTEYIIRLLKDKYRLAVLSRGYKRKTNGFILASDSSTGETIGDEPFQMKLKFPQIIVAVDNNRRRGISSLLQLPDNEKPEVILLDDAYQHRYVKPSFSILISDFNRLFYKDMLLPAGLLREPKEEKSRADVVIVSKCPPGLQPIDFRIIGDELRLMAYQHLFFTHIVYGELQPVFPQEAELTFKHQNILKDDQVLLVAGIASSELFIEEVKKQSDKVSTVIFPDHQSFGRKEIKKIRDAFDRIISLDKYIVMTEKDAARLIKNPLLPEDLKSVLYYLPIEVDFIAKPTKSLARLIEHHIITIQQNTILKHK